MRAHDEDATRLRRQMTAADAQTNSNSVLLLSLLSLSLAFSFFLSNFLAYLHALHATKIDSIFSNVSYSSFPFFSGTRKKPFRFQKNIYSLKNQHEIVTRRKSTAAKFVE